MATKRPDGRVEPGQRISSAFSARAWNRAQDAADIVLGAKTGTTAEPLVGAGAAVNIVLIKNLSGHDVPRHGVLGVSGVAIVPSSVANPSPDEITATAQFVQNPVLTGITPTTLTHSDRFVVTMEPIPNNSIGRAAVSGVFACRVKFVNASHRFAGVENNDRTQLATTDCGLVQLLWVQPTGFPPLSIERRWAVGVM
jgi:hypothetical protein